MRIEKQTSGEGDPADSQRRRRGGDAQRMVKVREIFTSLPGRGLQGRKIKEDDDDDDDSSCGKGRSARIAIWEVGRGLLPTAYKNNMAEPRGIFVAE